MAWNDPTTLNLLASLLIVLVMARVVSDKWRFDLWWFGLYLLGACSVTVAVLLVSAEPFKPAVFLFGVAVAGGLYWTGAMREAHSLNAAGHGVAVGTALALTGLLAVLAVNYRWWIAPMTLLLAMSAGVAVNGVVPLVRSWRGTPTQHEPRAVGRETHGRGRSVTAIPSKPGRPVPAASWTGSGVNSATPQATPIKPASSAAATMVGLSCRWCGLAGQVPLARAGQTLACPRCGADVHVTSKPSGPTTGPKMTSAVARMVKPGGPSTPTLPAPEPRAQVRPAAPLDHRRPSAGPLRKGAPPPARAPSNRKASTGAKPATEKSGKRR